MKKITILVLSIVFLALAFTGCNFDAGVLPNVGGTVWTYTTEIDGVTYTGTISFGKRTDFSVVQGTITQTLPVGLTRAFDGTLDRYTLKINTIGLGGTAGMKFEGIINRWPNGNVINGSAYHSADVTGTPLVWQEGVLTANLKTE